MSEFTTHELAYLLGLASARRRKRERDAPKIKAGQNARDFERAHVRWNISLAWARQIEDKLILIVVERDPSLLRPSQHDRARELLARKAILHAPDETKQLVDCSLHGPQSGYLCVPCSKGT